MEDEKTLGKVKDEQKSDKSDTRAREKMIRDPPFFFIFPFTLEIRQICQIGAPAPEDCVSRRSRGNNKRDNRGSGASALFALKAEGKRAPFASPRQLTAKMAESLAAQAAVGASGTWARCRRAAKACSSRR